MNRLKKYIRNNLHIKLNNDYPWLPYDVKPHICIEDIHVNSVTATITYYYNVGDIQLQINRDGTLTAR